MLDTPCSEVVWRVLATHCIRQFLLHFSSCASPCAITFQLESNNIIIHYRSIQLTSVRTDRELYLEQLIRRRRLKQELSTFKLHLARSNYAHLVFLFSIFGLCRVCQYTECTEMRTILYGSKFRPQLCNLTLLWYHGVCVTPVLFDSRFFFETVTNTYIAFHVFLRKAFLTTPHTFARFCVFPFIFYLCLFPLGASRPHCTFHVV